MSTKKQFRQINLNTNAVIHLAKDNTFTLEFAQFNGVTQRTVKFWLKHNSEVLTTIKNLAFINNYLGYPEGLLEDKYNVVELKFNKPKTSKHAN